MTAGVQIGCKNRLPHLKDSQEVEQVVYRGCGFSILRGFQDWTGHSTRQPSHIPARLKIQVWNWSLSKTPSPMLVS